MLSLSLVEELPFLPQEHIINAVKNNMLDENTKFLIIFLIKCHAKILETQEYSK